MVAINVNGPPTPIAGLPDAALPLSLDSFIPLDTTQSGPTVRTTLAQLGALLNANSAAAGRYPSATVTLDSAGRISGISATHLNFISNNVHIAGNGTTDDTAAFEVTDALTGVGNVLIIDVPLKLTSTYQVVSTLAFVGLGRLVVGASATIFLPASPEAAPNAWIFDISASASKVRIVTPNATLYPQWWGARGDTKTPTVTCTISSGSASLVVGSATFAAGDVGKTIMIPNAGVAGSVSMGTLTPGPYNGMLVTTIISYQSSTHVTLAANASSTLSASSQTIIFGNDDTSAIFAALFASKNQPSGGLPAPLGCAFAAGAYLCRPASYTFSDPQPSMHIRGEGLVRIIGVNAASYGVNNIWAFNSNQLSIRGIRFEGYAWTMFGDQPGINNLLLIENAAGQQYPISDIVLRDLQFYGGTSAFTVDSGLRLTTQNIYADQQYGDSLVVPLAPAYTIMDTLNVTNSAVGQGIKFGYNGGIQTQTCENVHITNFTIENCGVQDVNPSNWQEGLDMFIGTANYIQVAHGIIRGCGGGIECKKDPTSLVPDIYQEIDINDVKIDCPYDGRTGISFHWTNAANGMPQVPAPSAANQLGRISILGCKIRCSFNTPTGGIGIWLSGVTDAVVDGGNNIIGWYLGVEIDGTGSTDATCRRIKVFDTTITDGVYGVSCDHGVMEEIAVERCSIKVSSNPFISNSGLTTSGTCAVRNSTLISTNSGAARFDAGTWQYTGNNVVPASGDRGYASGGGTVLAGRNIRGYASVTPVVAGAIGDVYLNSAPTAAGVEGWICVTAGGTGAATWKELPISA